jgi:hypothetical protein
VGRRSSRRSRRAQKKQSRADQPAKPPLTRKHRVLLGLAFTATALAFGALTWIGMALFLGPTASREVWTHVERASWVAGVVTLGLAAWGPGHRRPTPATDRHPLRWFGAAALAGIVIGGLVASIPPNPPSLAIFGKTYPQVLRAEVINTYRTDPAGGHPVDVGVHSYHGPYPTRQDRVEVGSYFSGDSVFVVCRVEDGRTIRDGTTKPSHRWYRLDDNSYLPDPFLDAPSGIPTCAEYDRQG